MVLLAQATLPVDVLFIRCRPRPLFQAADDNAAMFEQIDFHARRDVYACENVVDVGFIDPAVGKRRCVANPRCVVCHMQGGVADFHLRDRQIGCFQPHQASAHHKWHGESEFCHRNAGAAL